MIDRIFLTLFLDGGGLPAEFPPAFQDNLDALARIYPGARIKIYSLDEARAFLAAHFEADVREAFETLSPYSYKSDLVRYGLMYVYGGLYTDVAIRWLRPLAPGRLVVFKDLPQACSWSVAPGILYAEPGRPEFLDAIRRVVANVRARDYGANPLCPTGPNLFGRAVAAEGRLAEITFGAHRFLTPGEGDGAPAFVVDGHLVALKAKVQHGDISRYGFAGSNNYVALWIARRAYGETASRWAFSDPQIYCAGAERGTEAINFAPARRGVQTYGPYCPLDPGAYEATLSFGPDGFSGRLGMDVVADGGAVALLPYCAFAPEARQGGVLRVAFSVERPVSGVEVRTYNDADLAGALREITLARAP